MYIYGKKTPINTGNRTRCIKHQTRKQHNKVATAAKRHRQFTIEKSHLKASLEIWNEFSHLQWVSNGN